MKLNWTVRTSSVEREQRRLNAEKLRQAQQDMRAQARRDQELAELQHRAELGNLADAHKKQKKRRTWTFSTEKWTKRLAMLQKVNRGITLAGANVGVNVLAVTGQFVALYLGAGWPWWAALIAATITESIAINVGFYAHDRLIKGYSPIITRTCSYLIGLGVGVLSYWHNYDHPTTKDAAIMFALASLLSPILWHLYGVWKHADNQHVKGTHNAPAPSFTWQRWLIPSLRKETKAAYTVGISEGISDPNLCIEIVREHRARMAARRALRDTQAAVIAAQRAQLQLVLTHMAAQTQDLYGTDPEAAEAMQEGAAFINRVGAGLVPRYRPQILSAPGDGYETETSGNGSRPWWRRMFTTELETNTPARAIETGGLPATETGDGTTPVPGDETKTNTLPVSKTNGDGSARRATRKARPSRRDVRRPSPHPDSVEDLMPLGRQIAAEFAETGTKLTRDGLVHAFRARQQGLGTAKAGLLLARLTEEAAVSSFAETETETSTETDASPARDETETDAVLSHVRGTANENHNERDGAAA